MNRQAERSIQDQVRLPARVACGVVMQGIRIRFGRSLVTILGVVFGIAFLMSVLTSQLVKAGVGEEDRLRTEVQRMMSFLTAEIGTVKDRTIGIVVTGPLSAAESRFLEALHQAGPAALQAAGSTGEAGAKDAASWRRTAIEEVGLGAQAIVVAGDGPVPSTPWTRVLASERKPVVALTRRAMARPDLPGVPVSVLEREMKPEEMERAARDRRQTRFRNFWILVISLLVTVIGISNAMLMSVTERFREIGTMKCLGALSSFIRRIFLIESSFMGLVGGLAGALIGAAFSLSAYGLVYGFGLVMGALPFGLLVAYFGLCVVAGVVLSMVAAIYPATVASGMVPADALRSNV